MLTPEYIRTCADDLVQLYDELDRVITEEITEQIVKHGDIKTVWENETYRRRVMQDITDDTIKKIAATTKHTEAEIRRMFEKAVTTSKKLDLSPLIIGGQKISLKLTEAQQHALIGALRRTNAEVNNLTGTLGATAAHRYEQAVNAAYLKVQTGAYSPQRAVCDAVLDIVKDGNYVLYPSGHRDRIDVATARAVRTGISQTCGSITLMDCKEYDCGLVETSAHYGARQTHAQWQGKIFQLEGSSFRYPNFYAECGYGEGDGICGYNCRHSFYPYWEGYSRPAYSDLDRLEYDSKTHIVDGKPVSEYEVTQMLRKDERAIRDTKRQIAGIKQAVKEAKDPEVKALLHEQQVRQQGILKTRQEQYKTLAESTGHKIQNSRTAMYAVQDDNGNILRYTRREAAR